METCEDKKNIGVTPCTSMPDMPKGMIWTPPGFTMDEEDLEDPEVWQAKLLLAKGSRIFLWPEFDKVESASTPAAYDQSVLSDNVADQGKYAWRCFINQGLCLHTAMATHSTKNGRVWIWMKNNKLLFTTSGTEGKFRGLRISLLNTEKLQFGDGALASYTPIYLVLRDHTEIDKRGKMIDASFIPDLIPIVDVKLAIVSSSDSTIVFDAYLDCDNDTKLTGLVAADIQLLTTAGVAQTKTLADNGNGRYTLTAGTTFSSGTLTLVAPASLTLKSYEAVNTLSFTIA